MKLRYIALGLDEYIAGNMYSSIFDYHTRFICNYLSRMIRKVKFETDGTFNQIYIEVGEKKAPHIFLDNLVVSVPFNKEKYEKAIKSKDCSYFADLLERGFEQARHFKPIPYEELLNILNEFKTNKYDNSWLIKQKIFRDENLKVKLMGHLTIDVFYATAHFYTYPKPQELCSGILFSTLPDEIHFAKTISDISVKGRKLFFHDYIFKEDEIIEIDIDKIKLGEYNYKFIEIPKHCINDIESLGWHQEYIKNWSYLNALISNGAELDVEDILSNLSSQ